MKTGGINAYRVDDLQPNALVVCGVVKEAGSETATPNATYKQLLWWNANAKKTKSGSANAATPLTPEERARRSEIKAEAKKILRGIEMRNAEFGKPITISNNSIKEWTNQPFTEYMEKNEALLVLPKLIKEAKYLGWGKDEHDADAKMHLFETLIGHTKSWIIVREMHTGEYAVHSISDKQKILDYLTNKKT